MRELARRIREVVSIEKPDLLHAHSPVLNVVPALYVGKRTGIPVLYEIRAFWEDAAVDQMKFAEDSWRYRVIRGAEGLACRCAAQTFVLCRGIQADLHGRGIKPEKVIPVRNGVDVDSLCPCPADDEYRSIWNLANKRAIGFIGSFYRYEGLELLIEAFEQLADRCPDVVLLLLGGGEMENDLRAKVSNLRLADRVVMPGRIPHERIAGVYALMEFLIYPRHSVRLTELVTPLKPLEAMAMGKPVILSDIGGHRELARDGETGLFFKAGDASALTDRIVRLLDDSGLRERLARRGRDFVVQEHSWKTTTAPYKEAYARVLSQR